MPTSKVINVQSVFLSWYIYSFDYQFVSVMACISPLMYRLIVSVQIFLLYWPAKAFHSLITSSLSMLSNSTRSNRLEVLSQQKEKLNKFSHIRNHLLWNLKICKVCSQYWLKRMQWCMQWHNERTERKILLLIPLGVSFKHVNATTSLLLHFRSL